MDDQRFAAARCAISLRRSGESFSALAFPPFIPPLRPKATAAGFFPLWDSESPIASSTTRRAFCATSLLLDRLGIAHHATLDGQVL